MQSNTNQIQPIIETSSSEVLTSNNSKNLNVSMNTIPEANASNFADGNTNVEHGNVHDNTSPHETLYEDSIRNTMLTQYNWIVIGPFKEFFQSVDMNNLSEALQALKELNFMVANRAPEIVYYYNMPLEPHQITTEEVPDLGRANIHHSSAYNTENSIRGRPHMRGNSYHRYARQSSPLPRYQVHYKRSDNHVYSNRSFYNTHTCNNSQHVSPQTFRNIPNNNNNQINDTHVQSPNNSNILGCLQSQILGLQTQALQHSMLNSIKIFDGNTKSEFMSWVQSVENAAKLCNLDTLSIALSKLQGLPLKSACFLESKEVNVGKQLSWHSLKKHLTNNYSEILYGTHAINAYDNLHQGSDESTSAYLHREQDVLEHIHHMKDMAIISAIGTNHAKILTGLKDGRLNNELAESKAKKWTNMSEVLQDVADVAINFERSHGYLLPTFEVQYISSNMSSSSFRPHRQSTKNTQNTACLEKPKCWHCQGDHYKKDCPTAPKQSLPTKQLLTKDKQHNLIKIFARSFRIINK